MSGPTFFLEVGTEEIPDRMLAPGQRDLQAALAKALEPLEILEPGAAWESWSAPRRLACAVGPLRMRQADREEKVMGPAVRVAFDADGVATKAGAGFAHGQKVSVDALQRVQTPKGEYVAVQRVVEGRTASELLGAVVPEVLRRMHFPKMMRWGDVDFRFVRPIRWIVALVGGEVVPLEVAGVWSGRNSRGHRRLGSPEVRVTSAAGYVDALRATEVLVDPDERRDAIRAGLAEAPGEFGGEAVADEGLVEILVHMTECPAVIGGSFPEEFLELPREVLVTAMRHHQRYFSVVRPGQKTLLPAFLAVLDRPGDPTGVVRRGNEWVLRARLADARFFWGEDRKRLLLDRLPELERVIFQEKLGSYRTKVDRLGVLTQELGFLLERSEAVRTAAARAALLAKCDLTTEMVKEFPELQGIMGGIYARLDGESTEVSDAIYEHYRPAGAVDALPATPAGRLLVLADRLDTLVGYFALGAGPTGTRDPFALRRAGLAVVRLLIEGGWSLSLTVAVGAVVSAYGNSIEVSEDSVDRLLEFLRERARFVSQGAGHRYDSVTAVLAAQSDDLHDASLRLQALTSLRADPEHEEAFDSLSSAFKRIRNLTKDQEEGELDPATLVERPERELHQSLESVTKQVEASLQAADYLASLRAIASLRPAVDAFLGSSRDEGVLVMSPDERLRRNRLALLRSAGRLFTRIADFSEIVVEGVGAETAAGAPEGRSS